MRTATLRQCDVSHYFWLDGFTSKGRIIYFKIDMFYHSTYEYRADLNRGLDNNGSQQGIKKTIYDAQNKALRLDSYHTLKGFTPYFKEDNAPIFQDLQMLDEAYQDFLRETKSKKKFFYLRYINTTINEIQEVECLEDEEDF